jgi:hypothetical protein
MHPGTETPLERGYLAFLAEVATILGEPLPYEATLQRVCDAAVRTVADVATMYLYDENDELKVVAGAHVISDRSERLRRRAVALLDDPAGPRWWFESVIRIGKSLLVSQIDEASLVSAGGNPKFTEFILETGVRSFIIVPFIAMRGVIGALALVYTDHSGLRYDYDALAIAQDLGRRLGSVVGKVKLHETAVDVSTRFQLAALPKSFPNIAGFELDSLYEPASSEMMVGGDWFDAFALPGGRLGLSVGDISGHGAQAAAFMGSIRDSLRVAMYLESDLAKVIDAADTLIRSEDEDVFATACVAVVDPARRTLSCLTAGHPGPLCWSGRDQRVTDPFRMRGLPLGFGDLASPERPDTLNLNVGDFIVFFTDGVVEGDRDYLGGEALLLEAIARPQVRESPHPAVAIRGAVTPLRHPDDLAILTIYVRG